MRAGNVIGGGDFAADRIIPDCIRAAREKKDIIVRNPHSTRPYQHVLEPVMAYLMVAAKQYEDKSFSGNYNVGPDDMDCVTTGDLTELFCKHWNNQTGENLTWKVQGDGGPHEANFLKLDCSKMKYTFGWRPAMHVEDAIEKIVEFTVNGIDEESIRKILENQINSMLNE